MSDIYSKENIKVIDLSKLSLPEVIAELKRRPERWLPEANIQYLHVFLLAWLSGRGDETSYNYWHAFNEFVESKYNVTTTIGWANIIESKTSNTQEALELFFELVENYEG